MKKLCLLFLLSCSTSTSDALTTLTKAGYKKVVIGDPGGSCGAEYLAGRQFTALLPNGTTASGIVCCQGRDCVVAFK